MRATGAMLFLWGWQVLCCMVAQEMAGPTATRQALMPHFPVVPLPTAHWLQGKQGAAVILLATAHLLEVYPTFFQQQGLPALIHPWVHLRQPMQQAAKVPQPRLSRRQVPLDAECQCAGLPQWLTWGRRSAPASLLLLQACSQAVEVRVRQRAVALPRACSPSNPLPSACLGAPLDTASRAPTKGSKGCSARMAPPPASIPRWRWPLGKAARLARSQQSCPSPLARV
mmetsp:Transcript_6590/g.17686  ORF Transcript_6590/g.17686 Transcript_6590/m.17686 type:complete len:227 (+) Transcript_6590:357-1037(+)